MSKRPKGDHISPFRSETIRGSITEALQGGMMTARDISAAVRIPEKEVYDHLKHIQRSVSKKGLSLKVIPAECRKCGFVFRKRDRLTKPGKCPVCRGSAIEEPVFGIEAENG